MDGFGDVFAAFGEVDTEVEARLEDVSILRKGRC